jgi:2-iminobutanoate/2-iminopropanoate deaminase
MPLLDRVTATFGEHRPARAALRLAGSHHGFRVAADAVGWCVR